jgi:hypothetical protein
VIVAEAQEAVVEGSQDEGTTEGAMEATTAVVARGPGEGAAATARAAARVAGWAETRAAARVARQAET